jgi:hypothetical protein
LARYLLSALIVLAAVLALAALAALGILLIRAGGWWRIVLGVIMVTPAALLVTRWFAARN